jgi:hypothetical protein
MRASRRRPTPAAPPPPCRQSDSRRGTWHLAHLKPDLAGHRATRWAEANRLRRVRPPAYAGHGAGNRASVSQCLGRLRYNVNVVIGSGPKALQDHWTRLQGGVVNPRQGVVATFPRSEAATAVSAAGSGTTTAGGSAGWCPSKPRTRSTRVRLPWLVDIGAGVQQKPLTLSMNRLTQ